MKSFTNFRKINILFFALLLTNFSIPKKISKENTIENQNLKSILDLQASQSSSLLSTSTKVKTNRGVRPMENSGYLFYGYNLHRGNPHSTTGSIDPGFTNPIFESNYSKKMTTGDLRFLVPNGAIFAKNVGCDVSMANSEITGVSSYKSALDVDVSASGKFWGVSFAASASYNEINNNMKSSNTIYVEQKADCRVFQGHIEYYKPPLFYETFVTAFQYLHDKDFEKNKDDYYSFINYYGTHFLEKIVMGARFGLLHKMTIDEYSTFKETGVNVSVSASYLSYSGSASVDYNSAKSDSGSRSFGSKKVFSIGASPPANGDPMTWAASAISEPMPISYRLRPMMDILTNPFFNLTQFTSANMDLKRLATNLGKAYENYCQDYLKKNGELKYCSQKELPKEVEIPDDDDDLTPEDKIKIGFIHYNLMFRNLETNNCLTAVGDNIVSSRCDEKNSGQRWVVFFNADTASHRLYSLNRKKVADKDTSRDSQLQLWRSHDKKNQRITLQEIDNNVNLYSIIIEDECLQVKNNNKADNAPLAFSRCSDSRSHRWRISK